MEYTSTDEQNEYFRMRVQQISHNYEKQLKQVQKKAIRKIRQLKQQIQMQCHQIHRLNQIIMTYQKKIYKLNKTCHQVQIKNNQSQKNKHKLQQKYHQIWQKYKKQLSLRKKLCPQSKLQQENIQKLQRQYLLLRKQNQTIKNKLYHQNQQLQIYQYLQTKNQQLRAINSQDKGDQLIKMKQNIKVDLQNHQQNIFSQFLNNQKPQKPLNFGQVQLNQQKKKNVKKEIILYNFHEEDLEIIKKCIQFGKPYLQNFQVLQKLNLQQSKLILSWIKSMTIKYEQVKKKQQEWKNKYEQICGDMESKFDNLKQELNQLQCRYQKKQFGCQTDETIKYNELIQNLIYIKRKLIFSSQLINYISTLLITFGKDFQNISQKSVYMRFLEKYYFASSFKKYVKKRSPSAKFRSIVIGVIFAQSLLAKQKKNNKKIQYKSYYKMVRLNIHNNFLGNKLLKIYNVNKQSIILKTQKIIQIINQSILTKENIENTAILILSFQQNMISKLCQFKMISFISRLLVKIEDDTTSIINNPEITFKKTKYNKSQFTQFSYYNNSNKNISTIKL